VTVAFSALEVRNLKSSWFGTAPRPMSAAQVTLAYSLRHAPLSFISNTVSAAHLKENLAATEIVCAPSP
jgi:aryl-alcohol dehydrogenase-like predicted oxidoreductase